MLTLITVNYNNAKGTIGLLRSLEDQTRKDFDIIVVDNDSQAEDRELLGGYASSSQLGLDVIYSDTNRGFAGGNNLAIRKALAQTSDWLVLINNDTTVSPDFIATLEAKLPTESALVGIPLFDGSRTVYAGKVAWLKPTLSHMTEYGGGRNRYVIGAGMAIHRKVLERAGLMDEGYFLYFEDADYTFQVRRSGLPIRFLNGPIIQHRESESTRRLGSPLLLRYHLRNALRFNWRNGPFWVRLALPFWSAWVVAKQLLKFVIKPDERNFARAINGGIIDFYAGKTGKI